MIDTWLKPSKRQPPTNGQRPTANTTGLPPARRPLSFILGAATVDAYCSSQLLPAARHVRPTHRQQQRPSTPSTPHPPPAMAAATEPPPPAPSIATKPMPDAAPNTHSCPACGTALEPDMASIASARQRIQQLEEQAELLKAKAAAAVDKCADYEDQLARLQTPKLPPQPLRSHTLDSFDPARLSSDEAAARPNTASSNKAASRFSFFAGVARRASPANAFSLPPPPAVTSPPDSALLSELERERSLRAKAEERVQKVDIEIEELSVQLFSQANEMVAEERRARAKLEERVETLERRDREKMARLDRLEKAVERVERVKKILGGESGAMLMPVARK
ncbi:hypothetical protein NX059_010989 [Plenodomus lindquistii]|nr:hypothetical protein NX059_010989 [Plenodomus lindquistii]